MTCQHAAPSFVEVVVPLPLDRPFTYRVPSGQEGRARPGVRALVPFGRRRLTGLVTAVTDGSSLGGRPAREVIAFLDEEPYVTEAHLAFIAAAARECLAPLGEMLRAALPRGLARREAPPAPRTEAVYRAAPGAEAARLTPKQARVLAAVAEAGEISSAELSARVPNGAEVARRMAARGWLVAEARERPPAAVSAVLPPEEGKIVLTPAQEAALARIAAALEGRRHAVFLLHGVTGSGKTEVYLRAMERARAVGRQSLFLVPEIALTPQLLGRVRARFGDDVAVLHSGLSPAARTVQWRRVRAGAVSLCVGARSAVFAPFDRLGLFVVDEEHDPAYKQEEGVRYQARDLALLRARMEGAAVVLGSATPSAETWGMVESGEAVLLPLPERIGARALPEVRVVDLRDLASRRGADRYFSPVLEEAVEAALSRGEKVMLFLNRRGYAPAITCLDCGATVMCRNCQVAMTWHRQHEALLCHYCNDRAPLPDRCAACGGHRVAQVGLGTERLAAWAAKRWKSARVARLDSDAARRRGACAEVLSRMQRGEVDILVGTQMITKGHDFPAVTLVGILLADQSLLFPDFRAAERTFQLLTQAAGRAGRGDRAGTVIVQTLSPEHACLAKAAAHDFEGFMREELAQRAALGYPPFGRLVLLRLAGARQDRVHEAATRAAGVLANAAARCGAQVLGPAPSPIPRVRGKFHYQVLLKGPRGFSAGEFLAPLLPGLREEARRLSVGLEADVDPYDMMV